MAASSKPELLAPAGSLETLKVAIAYGADAVYVGGENYGLRAKAKNFSMEEMREGVGFAHKNGRKVFVAANITAHDGDLAGMRDYFKKLSEIGPDALIISDPGVFKMAREACPGAEIHISTQANSVNYMTCRFWHELGAKRVVLARELTMDEIRQIRAKVPDSLEMEVFVHGAMCISYSGRCLLSNYFAGRDANLGECAHPCRWKYHVMEETRPGEYLPVEEDERGTYIFSSKDLCMVEHVPDLVDAGIDSCKIEGRMKTALYVACVTRTYRQAIDDYFESPKLYDAHRKHYMDEISKCTYRQFTTGFFYGTPSREAQIYDGGTYVRSYVYLGIIKEVLPDGYAVLEQKNKFCVGDMVEIMKPAGDDARTKVEDMRDENGARMESCPHPGQRIEVLFNDKVKAMDIIRAKA